MFDQGKVGSNSNTSITQRIAVITATIGRPLKSIKSSRYIRWQGDERNTLFSKIKSLTIDKRFTGNFEWPVLGEGREKKFFSQMRKSNRTIEDIESKNGRWTLYIPDSLRYFISAVRKDLERGQKELHFDQAAHRNLAQIVINSDLFYWYWRATDGGFSVTLGGLRSMPIPSVEVLGKFQTRIDRMADRLHRNAKGCTVTKENKGPKKNVKYDKKPKLMNELNELICEIYELGSPYNFHGHKANSIQGFIHALKTGERPRNTIE
jgi:hypothetical protein